MALFKAGGWFSKLPLHFDKLLLTGMFIGTVALCVHLMNKADAGGDEMAFLIWAETQAAIILGALLALIKGESGAAPTAAGPAGGSPAVPPAEPPALPIEPPALPSSPLPPVAPPKGEPT